MEPNVTGQAGHTPPTAEILDGLNDLLQLDHDALGAYDIAIEKLQDRDHANQIAGYRLDHERHVRELNQAVAALGGTPKNEPHATGPFKQALQSLGGLAGDKGLLIAWRTNELQVRAKYDSYASRANSWPEDLKRMVDRNALDEERHYRWVAEALQRMGVGGGESSEQAGTGALDAVRERAADLAGGARERVAGGLDAVANRISHLAEGREGAVGGVADRVAGGVGGTARYVRDGSVDELRTGFEEQVRRSPVQTLLVAALAGFVIGRILR